MGGFEPITRALRERRPDLLHLELVDTLVSGESEWLKDERDLMMSLAPFHHCARSLGLDRAGLG